MKKLILLIVFVLTSTSFYSQTENFQLSTHILDITEGTPAGNVLVKLEQLNDNSQEWTFVSEKRTNQNGRIDDFLPIKGDNEGIYRFTFYTAPYFKQRDKESFYPFVEVVFRLEGVKHFHVPITLSAYGYSTYRGN